MASHGQGSLLEGIGHGSGGSGGAQKSAAGPTPKDPQRVKAIVAGVAAVVGIALMCFLALSSFLKADAGSVSATRVVIDAETGELFESYKVIQGDAFPYVNTKTGKRSLYPAEPCFWTKDGKAKLEPTYVLLNAHKYPEGDKRHNEPTLCPDCGHVVTPHNKMPPSNLFPQK
ncbi:MAG: hypothetical protein QM783_11170 [Phycisphaerales bacterium]